MDYYVLVDRKQSWSSINSCEMYRFTWISLSTFDVYETTVDPSYGNWTTRGWQHLSLTDTPWGVYTGLKPTKKRTKSNVQVITADSKPQLLVSCESQDLACDVVMKAQL